MSNLTAVGKKMIPQKIGVPFDHFKIITREDGTCCVQMTYRGDVVWQKELGILHCGDEIKCGPVEGTIPVHVDF